MSDKSLTIWIDGVKSGEINSPALVKAFTNVYLDANAVAPTLKTSISSELFAALEKEL